MLVALLCFADLLSVAVGCWPNLHSVLCCAARVAVRSAPIHQFAAGLCRRCMMCPAQPYFAFDKHLVPRCLA